MTCSWDIAAGLPVVLDDGDARYVYGATGLISQVTVADTYYHLTDGLGSTMVTTDSAGGVANAYTYDVFGAPRSQTGAQANEFQFAGEQVDASTGLQYLRARYYDFEAGRFISREPLSAIPGWSGHPYGYGNGNPSNFVDPSGLCSMWVYDCIDDAWGGAVSGARAAGEAIANGADWTADRVAAIAAGAKAIATHGVGALAGAADSARKAAWRTIRAVVNAKLSAMALGFAAANGLSCRTLRNGLMGCFGADFLANSAVTIGNVIFVKEKSIDSDLLDHEEAHADQWAFFGLSTMPEPLVGQAVFAASYGAFQKQFGSCGNPFEPWSDLGKGGYEKC